MTVSPAEWAQIRNLNAELKVSDLITYLCYISLLLMVIALFQRFLDATKRMEGDAPTGCMVIAEYIEIEKSLQARVQKLDIVDAMYPMLAAMLQKTQEILQEALSCDTLIMACILHPAFRLRFFHTFFGPTSAISIRAEALFNQHFQKYQASALANKDKSPNTPSTTQTELNIKNLPQPSIFSVYNDIHEEEATTNDNQLRDYLGARDRMKAPEYDMRDPKSALAWWKVC